jgi:hypothetical protein
MWRQRLQAKAIRERETHKLVARPPEPAAPAAPEKKPENIPVPEQRAGA